MSKFILNTEKIFSKSKPIDKLKSLDAIQIMINEQIEGVKTLLNTISDLDVITQKIYEKLSFDLSSRLIYVGAGTSGRIGVQDGAELYPTFGWPKSRVEFCIAGGKKALINSIENAEDDVNNAKSNFKKLLVSDKDIVLGISASGRTPFTNKFLELSKANNALCIAISNNENAEIFKFSHFKIFLDTKEEVIAGSTRLKAGTSQKACLNIITSIVMIKLGRVKMGMMNFLVPSNQKLRERKKRIDIEI